MATFAVRRRVCAAAVLLLASAPASALAGHRPHSMGVPPISGVIHERAGSRPTLTVYGHIGRSIRYGALVGYGRAGAAARPRIYAAGRPMPASRSFGRRAFAGRGFVGGFGGGLAYASDGYGAPGTYGAPGVYGGIGTYGGRGTYGGEGVYGTTATQSLFGNGGAVPYRSERPLSARYVEPPLGPSPDAPYDPGNRYAGDGFPRGGSARLIRVGRPGDWRPCTCEPRILPYGVGTAY